MSFQHRHRRRVQVHFGEQSMTKQSHKAECDIHNILRQFSRTGVIAHISAREPSFQDLPDSVDYLEALNIMQRAEESFAALPSSVREHFSNDPEAFLYAFRDPAQAEYLRSVGLLNKKEAAPTPAEPGTD